MKDQIIKSIYKVLCREIENENGFSYGSDLSYVAIEIEAAIAPFIGSSEVEWQDAPPWAKYRTLDRDGVVTYWETKPEKGFSAWIVNSEEKGRYYCKVGGNANWDNSLEQRPG